MGPLIALPLISMVGKMVGGASDVVEGATKSAAATTAIAQYETESTNTRGKPVDFDSNGDAEFDVAPEMFGGLDLGKVKSAIDDRGLEGPPEEGPKTVYKQMINQLQTISSTLLRMEESLRMLLAIEYERITVMKKSDVQQSLDTADTDDNYYEDNEEKEEKRRRGLKDMLGGVYNTAKGGFGMGTFGKLLGLGGLLLLMGKFRDNIIGAMAKTMEWFDGAYDYFTAEDFSFEKLATDFKDKFMPKLFETLNGIFGSMFSYVKELAFGASGDKRIIQESAEGSKTKTTLKTLTDKAIAGGDKLSNMTFHDTLGLKGVNSLSEQDSDDLFEAVRKHMFKMDEISKQSKGRIQWSTFPNFRFGEFALMNLDDFVMRQPISSFMNANPVIDGVPYESWDVLNNINLDAMAGITKGMSESRADKIRDVLKRKTQAYQAKESQLELNAEYLALDPQIMPDMPGLKIIETDGTTDTQKTYKKVVTNVSSPMDDIRSAKSSQRPLTLADQSTINNINAGTVNNVPMGAVNNLWTARLYANANTVLANSN